MFRGSPYRDLRTLNKFKLCGVGPLQNTMTITTMWDEIDQAIGISREEELTTKYWRPMLSAGMRTARLENGYQSAWEIVDGFPGVAGPLHIFTAQLGELRAKSQVKHLGREEERLAFPNLDALIDYPSEPRRNLSTTILALQDAQCIANMYRLPLFKDAVSLGLTIAESFQVRLGNYGVFCTQRPTGNQAC